MINQLIERSELENLLRKQFLLYLGARAKTGKT